MTIHTINSGTNAMNSDFNIVGRKGHSDETNYLASLLIGQKNETDIVNQQLKKMLSDNKGEIISTKEIVKKTDEDISQIRDDLSQIKEDVSQIKEDVTKFLPSIEKAQEDIAENQKVAVDILRRMECNNNNLKFLACTAIIFLLMLVIGALCFAFVGNGLTRRIDY